MRVKAACQLQRRSMHDVGLVTPAELCRLPACLPAGLLQIPNFWSKYAMGMAGLYTVGLGLPVFAVWWQQSKLKVSLLLRPRWATAHHTGRSACMRPCGTSLAV